MLGLEYEMDAHNVHAMYAQCVRQILRLSHSALLLVIAAALHKRD